MSSEYSHGRAHRPAVSGPGTLSSVGSSDFRVKSPSLSKYDRWLVVIVWLSSWSESELQLKPAQTSEGDRLSSSES